MGTIDSYYQSNMDLLKPTSPIDLYQPVGQFLFYDPQLPPARTIASVEGNQRIFINSMIANGVVIEGSSAQNSIFFPKVKVSNAAIVIDSILFEDVEIGRNCHIQNCIIDKNVKGARWRPKSALIVLPILKQLPHIKTRRDCGAVFLRV
ncbi:hypothetical protein O9992_25225 [Vibrio lentus]|nr:hypothetical protein [Vibrio lentus]